MSIGTFLIVYRVYYQQRRVFRSRRSGQHCQTGATPNKAKGLFYLLFTLNLLYFILVSPVVFTTSILFRDPKAEVSYPRFKAIIYLMQYCNHSLNFIFYGTCLCFAPLQTPSLDRKRMARMCPFRLSRYHVAALSADTLRVVCSSCSVSTSMLPTNDRAAFENSPDETRPCSVAESATDASVHEKRSAKSNDDSRGDSHANRDVRKCHGDEWAQRVHCALTEIVFPCIFF